MLGGIALLLMTISIVRSTRAKLVEALVGGLDRMYQVHRVVGVSAAIVAFVHVFVVSTQLSLGTDSSVRLVPSVPLGILGLVLLVMGLFAALNRRISYSRWRSSPPRACRRLPTGVRDGSTRSRHLESPRRRENSRCRRLRTASRTPGRQRIADVTRLSVPAAAARAVLRPRGARRLHIARQRPRRPRPVVPERTHQQHDRIVAAHAPFASSRETRHRAADHTPARTYM